MIVQNIKMQRARTGIIVVTVDDVESWAGLTAKLYVAKDFDETPVFELVGSIDSDANTITFSYSVTNTASLLENRYVYEVVLFSADLSFAQTTTQGIVLVDKIIKETPTV